MRIEIEVEGTHASGDVLLGWVPRRVAVSLSERPATTPVVLEATSTGAGGALSFAQDLQTAPQASLRLEVPQGVNRASFLVAGRFPQASAARNDAEMTLVATAGASSARTLVPMTVLVRKNANGLTVAERDRFLVAYARLNNQGRGLYQTFRDMHTRQASSNLHGGNHFLPWHRAFVLDLERELQAIDPLVALPYWRFDQPASRVLSRDFMGATRLTSDIDLSPSNPLQTWITDGEPGFDRRLRRPEEFPPILDQDQTLARGREFSQFTVLEGNPHGAAHVSFEGPISSVPTAAKDPLFFLLHCNVDRLWANWQYFNARHDPASRLAYPDQGRSSSPDRIARRVLDTMWPWDNQTGGERPPSAPGGPMQGSSSAVAPGPTPTIGSMIDYQGRTGPDQDLGYDYDDVPYWGMR